MNDSILSTIQMIVAPFVYIVVFLGIPSLLTLPFYLVLKRFIKNKIILRIVIFFIFLFMLIIFLIPGYRRPINKHENSLGISRSQNNIKQKGE